MSHDFAYQCPHCGETIRIADDVMGEVVDCPACSSPFKVDVPSARPGDPSQVKGDTPTVDRPDREETQLTLLHPAMLRAHPIKYLGYGGMLIMGVAVILLAMWDYHIIQQMFQIIVGGILIVVGGWFWATWWLETRYTTLIITNKRTILRKGIIAKNTSEVQHDDVRNIQVDQNMYERVVGVGDLAVSSAGQDDLEIHVEGIRDPDQVAETIRNLQ